ncbi:leucine rich repeat [Micractinium conductrix]|uniref:Leucine rich repeat n=1 Tax=Micractinium conductrix TaxID=554055 RepID=A0A2P6VRU1_9CHLO|nr:leucine rich repeat [Micractinium conductrix]|eukprot:PSC76801.1 leucine rich repeat [Micractinium conductrix]
MGVAAPTKAAAGGAGPLVCSPPSSAAAVARGKAGDFAGSAGPFAALAIDIQQLNEEAIEIIFTFLPVEDRRSAAAVCRLWRRVHNSSTKLWGSVLLSGERIMQAAASSSAGSVVAWLSARLEAMRAVRLWSPCHPLETFASGLAQLLSREGRLQSFSIVSSDVSVSRLLAELPGLTSLQLLDILAPALAPGQGLVVKARELARLKPLRNLLSLQLHAREIKGALPPALFRRLNRLQHLAISAKCRLPAAVVRQLTGLHSLELHGACMDAEAAEAAGALQHLTRLGISVLSWQQAAQQEAQGGSTRSGGGTARVAGRGGAKCGGGGAAQRWQDHPIWSQLPLLARLHTLAVGAELPSAGGDARADGDATVLPWEAVEGGVPDGIMDCASLTHLALPVALTSLPELAPGQLPRLQVLDLTHSIADGLPPSWCCHMPALRCLLLNGAPLAGGRLPAEFAALQGLRHLELRACRLSALPPCVAQLDGLALLDVGLNRLATLPPGPYLRSLRCLVARGNALRTLPPALVEAQQLEALDLGENEELVLQAGDIEGVLAPMPRLRHLSLARQPSGYGFGPYMSAGSGAAWDAQSVGVLMQLARALPQLSVQLERCPGAPPPYAAPAGDGPC